MTMDISRLGVEVVSTGIDIATTQLKALGSAADATEKKVDKLTGTIAKMLSTNMSATMQAWTGAMGGVNTAMASLSTSVQSTVAAINTQIAALNSLTPAIQRATNAQNNHSISGGVFINTLKAMSAAAIGYTAINFAMSIVHAADKWTDLNVKMVAATGSQNNATVALRDAYDIAQRLGTPLEGTVKLYARLAPALAAVGFASKDVHDVVVGLSSAFHLGGATTGEMSQAILNFSHAMSSGHMNLRAFNSLTAEAPLLLRAVAKQMTGGSMDALRTLVTAHKVGAKAIVDAVHSVQPEWDKLIMNRPVTVEMAMTRIKNTWLKTIGEMAQDNHFNSALADGLKQVEQIIPAVVKGLGNAFGEVLKWVSANKDKLAQIWEQVTGLIGDVFKLAASFGSWVGVIAGAGDEFSVIAELIFTVRLAVAGLIDGFTIVKNVLVDIGAGIINFLLTPFYLVIEGVGKAISGFGSLLELASKGAAAMGQKDLAKSLGESAQQAKDFAQSISDVGTNAKDSFAQVQKDAQASTEAILAGKGAVGQLLDGMDKVAEQQAKLKYDENRNQHPTTAPDPKAIAAAEKLTKEFERQKEALKVQYDQEVALNAALIKYGQDYEKFGPMQKELIKLQDDLAMKEEKHAGALAIHRAQELVDMAKKNSLEEQAAERRQKNLAADKNVLSGMDADIKTALDNLHSLEDKVAAIGGMKGDKKDNQVDRAQNSLDVAQGGFGLSEAATTKDIQDRIDKAKEYLTIVKQEAAAQKILDQAALGSEWDKMLDPKRAVTFGNSLTQAFGKVGKSLKTLVDGFKSYAIEQENLAKMQANIDKTTDPAAKLAKQQEMAQVAAQDQIKMYGDMAEAAQGFFKKGTTGYQVMGAAEKAFRAAELLMAIENFVQKSGLLVGYTALHAASTAEQTGVSVAGALAQAAAEIPKQIAYGVSALAAALTIPPPASYVAFAATAALLLAIGIGVAGAHSGGGAPSSAQRQAAQGTGTVLGDAAKQSQSIDNSIKQLANNSDIALQYSSGMLASLRSIQSALTGTTNSIALNGGGITGSSFSNSSASFKSEFLGASKSAFEGIKDIFTLNFSGMVSSVLTSLGFGTSKTLTDSGILGAAQTIGSILAGGFKASQYQDVTTKHSIFGISTGSSNSQNTQALDPSITSNFTQIVKGMASTVTQAAEALGMSGTQVSATLDKITLSLGNISLKGLTSAQITTQLTAVFSAFGDQITTAVLGPTIAKFQQAGEGLLETAVRVASGVETASFELGKLGLTAIKFTDIINTSGDIATEIVRQTIVMKEGADGISNIISTMSGTAAELVTTYQSLLTVRLSLQQLGIANDVSSGLINAAGGLTTLQTALDNYTKEFFTTAQQTAMATQALQQQFSALGLAMPNTKAQFVDLVNQLSASGVTGQDLAVKVIGLADAFNNLDSAAQSNISTLQGDLKTAYDAQSATLTTLKTAMLGFNSSLGTFKTTLQTGSLATGNSVDQYNILKAQYEDTLAKAKAGDQVALGKFETDAQNFLKASQTVNASGSNYTSDFQGVLAATQQLQDATATQATDAAQQLTALQNTVSQLITINTTVETVAQAIAALQAAITTGVGASTVGLPSTGSSAPHMTTLPVNSGTMAVASVSSGSSADLSAQVAALKTEVAGLRADNAAQAMMVATAVVSSSQANAAAVVDGTSSSTKQAAYAARANIKPV